MSIRKDQADSEPKQTNQIFKPVVLMLLMTNRVIMIVARQTTLFIIHLKSKTNRSETFDATEQLCDLNKNNGDGQTDDTKRS